MGVKPRSESEGMTTDTMIQRWGLCNACEHCAPLHQFPEQETLFTEGAERMCPGCGSTDLTVEEVAPVQATPNGQQLRDMVLATHEEQRGHMLDWIQTRLVQVAKGRETREVDADDAMEALDKLYETLPTLAKHDRRFMGALWLRAGWAKTGVYRPSRIPARHARPIPVWKWEGA